MTKRKTTRKSKSINSTRKQKETPRELVDPSTGFHAAPITLHVLSDSTGNLARHMCAAFLTQFPAGTFSLRSHPFCESPAKLDAALRDVRATGGIVLHAVMSEKSKRRVNDTCRTARLGSEDLTGRFFDFLSKEAGHAPFGDLRRVHDTGDNYLRRINALEFTLEHDDGLGLDSLHEAEVVLAGISRTSKTPTSIYLGLEGIRAANVALAIEVEPPKQLVGLDPKKVVGLTIDPSRLVELRTTRQDNWRMSGTSYNDDEHVRKEIIWSRRMFARLGWKTIDVTTASVEETAARIVDALKLKITRE